MKLFNKIAIIGVGLIGGSIGLAIKKRRMAGEVIGVFRHTSTMRKALRRKAVDRGVSNVRKGVKDADLIILAVPVLSIPALAGEAVRFAKEGAIITDAGSTKAWIVDHLDELIGRTGSAYFVGSHPMAGSDHTSVEFSRPDLLEGAPCIVTKTRRTDTGALKKVIRFWRALGARVEITTPDRHDTGTAFISHLPHLIAYSMAGAVPAEYLKYAAEGFKDTTRVASSDPDLWAEIFLTNKKEIVKAARAFDKSYKGIMRALSGSGRSRLVALLGRAKAKRDMLR